MDKSFPISEPYFPYLQNQGNNLPSRTIAHKRAMWKTKAFIKIILLKEIMWENKGGFSFFFFFFFFLFFEKPFILTCSLTTGQVAGNFAYYLCCVEHCPISEDIRECVRHWGFQGATILLSSAACDCGGRVHSLSLDTLPSAGNLFQNLPVSQNTNRVCPVSVYEEPVASSPCGCNKM